MNRKNFYPFDVITKSKEGKNKGRKEGARHPSRWEVKTLWGDGDRVSELGGLFQTEEEKKAQQKIQEQAIPPITTSPRSNKGSRSWEKEKRRKKKNGSKTGQPNEKETAADDSVYL